MTFWIVLALIALPLLIFLPFWLASPHTARKSGLIKDVLPPGQRRYTLALPEKDAGTGLQPLVVVLHYGGHGSPYYGEMLLTDLVKPALSALPAFFVAPDCPARDWTQPASEQFVLELIDYLLQRYPIDPGRVLLTGYSMGGIGAWHLAGKYPQRFSAALIMAAAPPESVSPPDWQTPVYVFHGRADELFPVANTNRVVAQLEEQGVNVRYRLLERVTHYETHRYFEPLQAALPWLLQLWQ